MATRRWIKTVILASLVAGQCQSAMAQQMPAAATYRMNGQSFPLYETTEWVAVRVAPGASLKAAQANVAGKVAIDPDRRAIFHDKAGILVEPVKPGAAGQVKLAAGSGRPVRIFHNGKQPPIVETDEFLIQFKPEIGRVEVDRLLNEAGAVIARPLGDYAKNGFVARLTNDGSSIAVANGLAGNPGVIYSYPNFIWPKEQKFIPNDPLYNQQWHLNNTGTNGTTGGTVGADIKAERAWEITRGSSSVVVAIVDDGVNTTHEEFKAANKIQPGWDFVDNDNTPFPDPALDSLPDARFHNNHGTACAGLAVAGGGNSLGGSGVAPGCRLMSVRLLGSNQTPETEAAAILSARDNGATIISNSWGPPDRAGPGNTSIAQPCPPNVYAAIHEVATTGRGGKGCIVLFAAGNGTESVDLDGYASHPDVICVAASTNQDTKSSYSDFGDAIDICAPGGPSPGDMVTCDRMGARGYTSGNYTAGFNGTSAATPVVAGVCALLLSKEPNLTRSQVFQRLIDTAEFIDTANVTYDGNGHNNWYGFGRVNAWKALAKNDTTDPTVTIRVPAPGVTATQVTAADGTASDTGLGVYKVQVALTNSSGQYYHWGLNGFSIPPEMDPPNHLKDVTVTAGVWSTSLPTLTTGTYRIHAKAIDKADNDSGLTAFDFTIDSTGPSVTIAQPQEHHNYAAVTQASGTAFDNIQEKRFALYRAADARWYNWVAGAFDSENFVHANHAKSVVGFGADWTLGLPGLEDGKFELHVMAIDQTGRASDWKRRNFRINTPPQLTVTTPLNGSGIQNLDTIGGDVSDPAGLGLQGNQVSFTLYNDGFYWTGSVWTTVQTTLHAPISGGSWTYASVPSGSDEKSGVYYVSAFVVDATGATSPPVPGVNQTSFRLDTQPPSVAITAPATGSTINTSTYQFRGTASDAGGIEAVNVFIRRASDNAYWNGSGWGISPIVIETDHNAATDEWVTKPNANLPILRGSADTQLPNGNYVFIAIAIDHAANFLQTDSLVTVDYHQIFHWTAGSHTDLNPYNNDFYWGNPANWSPNGVPHTEDIVNIDIDHTVRSTVSRTVHGFNMSTGALDFDNPADSLTITKTANWTGGTFFDSVFIPVTTSFSISGPQIKQIWAGGVIHNSGATTWTGPGVVRGYENSTWNNKPGSTFTMTGDGDVFGNHYGGNVFNNQAGALFIKTGGDPGSASTYIDEWTFNNHSRIECQQGTLHFNTTLNLNPGSNLAGAGRVLLNGTTNLATALASTGNPELIGTLNGTVPTAGFSGSHPFIWSNGWISGIFGVQQGSVLELTTGNIKNLAGGAVLTNHGRVNWHEGVLRGYENSTLNNAAGGIFDALTDGDIFGNHYGGNVFNNAAGALFIKSGKSATAGAVSFVDEWTFNNRGVIRSDHGVLQFHTILNLFGGNSIVRSGSQPARVLSTHYFVLTGTTTVGNITFETPGDWHGNLTEGSAGDGTIATVNGGIFEWSGGTAHNTVNISPGSIFQITGTALKQIAGGGVINHHGNATWSGTGDIRGYENSTFRNLAGATFTATTDADFINLYGGNAFVNAAGATFGKTSGADSVLCHWAIRNAGLVQSSSGSLAMYGGGVSSGTFAPTAGGEIHFLGGQHDLLTNATCTGTGVVRVNGGTVHAVNPVNSDFSNGLLDISSGVVTSAAAGSFGVTGNIDWRGGTIAGVFNIAPGSDFSLDGGEFKWIGDGGVINNSGGATWNPPGLLRGYQNSTWNNKSSGSFTLTGDGDVLANFYGGNVFNNEAGASVTKTAGGAGDASSYLDEWTINNNGALDCRQGTLHFYTTLNLGTGSNLLGAGRVLLNGTTNLATLLTSTGKPELIGTLNGTNPAAGFSGSHPFVWSSGAINGVFSLQSGSVMDLTMGNVKEIGNFSTFNNFGRVNWKAGLLRGYQNSTFNNESGAVFDAFTDGDVFANFYGGNVFNNKAGALFIKSGQSGTPDASTFIDEWTFNNSGAIRSEDGLLRFHTALNFEAGSSVARSGVLPARVLSSYYFVLTGTTTVSNITFESSGDWHGNLTAGSAGNGTLATQSGGVFEWTGGTAHNTVNIAPGSAFLISGSGIKQIWDGAILKNSGNATRTGAGELRGYQNSAFVNQPGGVFHVMTSAPFTNLYGGNRLTNSGVMNIGSSAGISPLHWSFTQTGTGRLNLEIGGTNPATPQFDQLNVSGDVNLAGTLGVSLINGYAPPADTAFPAITFGSRSGSFDALLSPGLVWGSQYNAGNLTLIAKTYPTTLAEWKSYFFADPGSADAQSFADSDRDGLSNLLEYALGRDPRAGGTSGIVAGKVVVSNETYLTLTFTRPAGAAALSDVNYTGERSGSLGGWSSAGVVVHGVVPVPEQAKETVTLRSSQPIAGATKDFLRLNVTIGN